MNTNATKRTETAVKTKPEAAAKKEGAPKCKGPAREPRTKRSKAAEETPMVQADHIKIGLDIGLRKYVWCRQIDHSLQEPPRVSSLAQFKEYVLKNKAMAKKVTVCYEAGLFGFELARWLRQNGIECIVMAPVKLDEGNKRVETDKLNARDICSRLDRYLSGNTRALTACRIPTREEELARHQTRQRQSLLEDRRALEARGRSLLWHFGYLEEGQTRWWEERQWKKLEAIDAQVVSGLNRWREVIQEIDQQIKELEEALFKQAEELPAAFRQAPLGAGVLSLLILTREIMNWTRFNNRRQVGCFTGLVPSESSTGESVHRGSISKVGNPVVRTTLIEMAWRFVRFQPQYHAIQRWRAFLLSQKKASPRLRKKAIVAVARQLAVDLWRLATGQTTAAQLGLTLA